MRVAILIHIKWDGAIDLAVDHLPSSGSVLAAAPAAAEIPADHGLEACLK